MTCSIHVDLRRVATADTLPLRFGADTNPHGDRISVDGTCLYYNGQPWLPTMGEFHYSRYPAAQWRDELLKMRSGGIDIAATYVFWNHHEEIHGEYDWSGCRDLRAYVDLCEALKYPLVLRIGPWCHGEVRLGGLPEWLLDTGCEYRTNDEAYLAHVEQFYLRIADQVRGRLWKDGGPIIGVQIENEYHGSPEHLLALKAMAIKAGFDVPFYTRTGWPDLTGPMPFGEMLPLHGGYAEGFWDRSLEAMPGAYWQEFTFQPTPTGAAIATDHFGQRDAAQVESGYPYLTCELGAGMMTSYHRRIFAYPFDAYAMALAKVGSGSNLPGYYMYHGGVNPDGKQGDLNEQQNTRETNHNDLPIKSYDFQTALGETGEVRTQFHLLRRLHQFLRVYGPDLCHMVSTIPDPQPEQHDDSTVRFAVRSNGHHGYLFVNNYQRLQPQPAKHSVQFTLKLSDHRTLVLPKSPLTIPADSAFFFPFNQPLSEDVCLVYATAQPLSCLSVGQTTFHFFAEIPGIPAEFMIEQDGLAIHRLETGRGVALSVGPDDQRHHVVLLDHADSLRFYQGQLGGKDVILLSDAVPLFDGDVLRLQQDIDVNATTPDVLEADVFRPQHVLGSLGAITLFETVSATLPSRDPVALPAIDCIQQAGFAREVVNGSAGVPEAPDESAFSHAAIYQVRLCHDVQSTRHFQLNIRYTGDVARVYAGDRLLTDNFFNSRAIAVDLKRYADALEDPTLHIKILPLRRDSPVHFTPGTEPDFGAADTIAKLGGISLIERVTATIACSESLS